MRQASAYLRQQVVVEPLEQRRMLSADVSLAFIGRPPTALPPTGSTRVAVRITDTGSPFSDAGMIRIYASADNTLDGSDVQLAAIPQPARLKPGQGATLKVLITAPVGLPNGSYFLIAGADGYPATAVTSKASGFANPFSDVAVQFENLPAQPVEIQGPSAGRRSVSVTVVNTGNIPVRGPVNLNFYLSNDAVLDASDPLLATVLTRPLSLKPGQHKAVYFRVGVPAGTSAGGYFLFATMAPSASLNDSNPSNNTAISSTRLAVVERLPLPPQHHHRDGDDDEDYGTYIGPVVYVDDGGEDYSTDDGSDDSDAPADNGDDGSGNSDSGGNSSPAPSDNGSDSSNSSTGDSSSSDDYSGDYDSTGGDF